MSDIQSILAQLDEPFDGGRLTNAMVASFFFPKVFRVNDGVLEVRPYPETEWRQPDHYAEDPLPEDYANSIDRVLGLKARELPPHWKIGFRQHSDLEGLGYHAWALNGDPEIMEDEFRRFSGDHIIPASALLIAFLKACEFVYEDRS